jgi:hypothetical protein
LFLHSHSAVYHDVLRSFKKINYKPKKSYKEPKQVPETSYKVIEYI